DDPVVDDDQAAGAVAMGMGVLFGGTAVRGPAGVAEAVASLERAAGERRLEVDELPRAPADFDVAVVDDRDAGRVVTAILETPEPLDEDGEDRPLTDVPDDAAHGGSPQQTTGGRQRRARRGAADSRQVVTAGSQRPFARY